MNENLSCRNVFKSGDEVTSQRLTEVWISMINQIEKAKTYLVSVN